MKKTINEYGFVREFENSSHKDNFSYSGLRVLFDYLEEIDCEMELDVVAISCDFSEMTLKEALTSYNLNNIEELRDNTIVLMVQEFDHENDLDNTIIIQAF